MRMRATHLLERLSTCLDNAVRDLHTRHSTRETRAGISVGYVLERKVEREVAYAPETYCHQFQTELSSVQDLEQRL